MPDNHHKLRMEIKFKQKDLATILAALYYFDYLHRSYHGVSSPIFMDLMEQCHTAIFYTNLMMLLNLKQLSQLINVLKCLQKNFDNYPYALKPMVPPVCTPHYVATVKNNLPTLIPWLQLQYNDYKRTVQQTRLNIRAKKMNDYASRAREKVQHQIQKKVSHNNKKEQNKPQPSINLTKVNNQIDKYVRFAKHSFIREALDSMFGKVKFSAQKRLVKPSSLISKLALLATKDPAFNSNHNDLYILPILVSNITSDVTYQPKLANQVLNRLKMAQEQGLKYILCEFNKDRTLAHYHAVKADDVQKLGNVMKKILKQHITENQK